MRRAAFYALAVAIAAFLGPVVHSASPAAACTFVGFHRAYLDDTVATADVIAVGTLEEPVDDVIALVVEEPLKGTLAGEVLAINNTQPLDCMGSAEPGTANYRAGDRVLVFLVRDTHGVAGYEVHRFGLDIFLLDEDVIAPYPGVNDGYMQAVPLLAAVRAEFTRVGGATHERGIEEMRPCNPPGLRPEASGDWARMAEAMVLGTASGSDSTATVIRVDEVYRGDVGPEIRLNDHVFGQANGGCATQMDAARRSFEAGTRLALLLVRDEFGVAEWRPAVWGTAVWEVNDGPRARYEGIPTLPEVRASVERVEGVTLPVAPPTDVAEAVEIAKPDDETESWLVAGALVVALLAAGAAGAAIVLRKRNT